MLCAFGGKRLGGLAGQMKVGLAALVLAAGLLVSLPASALAAEGLDGESASEAVGVAVSAAEGNSVSAQADVAMVDAFAVEIERDYDAAFEVLSLVNEERANAGLAPLNMEQGLLDAAMLVRAPECAVLYSHTRPDGQSCFSVFPESSLKGENIAAGQMSAESVMDSWMNSPDHRKNILDSDFKNIGIGCVYAGGMGPY